MQGRQDPPGNPGGQPYGIFHHPLQAFASERSPNHEDSLALISSSRGQRLPPRSRTGCWTCRRRKVKCDEARPVCAQCARLQQTCDYGPRITFRDDTPRICSRMRGVSTYQCPVWDHNISSRAYAPNHLDRLDDMASFVSLTNDEEREQKASFWPPGTYSVVAIPQSLASLPEYSDNDGSVRHNDFKISSLHIRGDLAQRSGITSAGLDDTTLVLDRFEMPMMQTIYQPDSQVNHQTQRQSQQPQHHHQHQLRHEVKQEDEGGETPESSVSGAASLALSAQSSYQLPMTPQFEQVPPQTFDATYNFQPTISHNFTYDSHHHAQQQQQHAQQQHQHHHQHPHFHASSLPQSQPQQQTIFHSTRSPHGAPYMGPVYAARPTNANVHPPLHRLHTHPGIPMQTPISLGATTMGYYGRASMPLSAGSGGVMERMSAISSPFTNDQWEEDDGSGGYH